MIAKKLLSIFIFFCFCLYAVNNKCSQAPILEKIFHPKKQEKKQSTTSKQYLPIPPFKLPDEDAFEAHEKITAETDDDKKIEIGFSYLEKRSLQNDTRDELDQYFTYYTQNPSEKERAKYLENIIINNHQKNLEAKDIYFDGLQTQIYKIICSGHTQEDQLITQLTEQGANAYYKISEHKFTTIKVDGHNKESKKDIITMEVDGLCKMLSQKLYRVFNEKKHKLSPNEQMQLGDELEKIFHLTKNKIVNKIKNEKKYIKNLESQTKEQQASNKLIFNAQIISTITTMPQDIGKHLLEQEIGTTLGIGAASLLVGNQKLKDINASMKEELEIYSLKNQKNEQKNELTQILQANESLFAGHKKKKTAQELLTKIKESQ